MTLVWAQDAAAAAAVTDAMPEAASGGRWATADPGLAWRWQVDGVPYLSPWPLVSLAEQGAVAEEALALADGWLAGNPALMDGGQDLSELGRTSLLYLFRDGLLAGRLAARLLDAAAPGRLVVAGTDVLAQVLRWEAQRRGLGVAWMDGTTAGGGVGLATSARLEHAAAAAVTAARMALARPARGDQPWVLFFGGGADFVNQAPLVARLRAARAWQVRHVALHPPHMAARGALAAGLPRPDLVLPPYGGPADYLASRGLGRRAWRSFEARGLPGAERYPWLFANPWLRLSFARFFLDTVPRAGGAWRAARQMLTRLQPDLVVLSNAASPRERAVLRAARALGVPSAQLIHSGFNDLHVHRVEADALWVWGEAHARQLAAAGVPAARVHVTGSPRLDLPTPAVDGGDRAALRRRLGLADDDVAFLLITARPPHLLAFVDPEGHVADLRAIGQALAGRPGVRLIVKPHPRYDDHAVYQWLAAHQRGVTVVTDERLERLLTACDVALTLNVGTTGGLEALLAGRPLVWLHPSGHYPPGFDLFAAGAAEVTDRAAIAPLLAELAAEPAARAALAERGRRYRPALLARSGDDAIAAVTAAMAELIATHRR